MGRYFQRITWPAEDFELTGALQAVPGSLTAFHSSGGVHLVALKGRVLNGTAGAITFNMQVRVDGVNLGELTAVQTVPAGAEATAQAVEMKEIPAGPHTIEVFAAGGAAVGDTMLDGTGVLTVIEFPSWETSDRIE